MRRQEATHLYEHSFTGHALRVTDVVIGYGGSNAIIVSASEDRTCKVCRFFCPQHLFLEKCGNVTSGHNKCCPVFGMLGS